MTSLLVECRAMEPQARSFTHIGTAAVTPKYRTPMAANTSRQYPSSRRLQHQAYTQSRRIVA